MSDMRYSEYVHSYGVPNRSFCLALRVLRSSGVVDGEEEEQTLVVVVGGVAAAVTVISG